MTFIYSAFIYFINIQVIEFISGLNMRESEVQQLFSFSHRLILLAAVLARPAARPPRPAYV